jgi:hypothetical protein
MDYDGLPWSVWIWDRCRAVKEPNEEGYWGRCELKKRHQDDHALERGFNIIRWSTKTTKSD